MQESNGSRDADVAHRREGDLVGLCNEARRGGITRRQFVERALLLGLSAGAVGALASACGGAETASTSATLPAMDETKPEQVSFYNWTDYLAPGLIKEFKKQTGIEVKQSYFTANEELLAKMKAGSAGYDVVVPSDWMVSVMRKSKLLEPLDMKYLPNFQYVAAKFQKPIYDDPDENGGLKYSVPYFYGSTGYVRRTDKVPEETTGWTPLFDPKNKGEIDMLDNPRETLGVGLLILGLDPNTTDQAELDQATDKLIEQKPLVAAYDSANMKRAIVSGLWFTHCWDGDALMTIDALGGDAKAKQLVAFTRPTEGFYTWVDNMSVPVGNNSRYGAHLWLDFLMDPQIAGKNASWVWYLSAVAPASWKYTDEFALTMRPTDEELGRAVMSIDVGEFQRAYDEAWRRLKSA
jgi:spermidine/putrescine transport system substrate-binding protein